jgi:hypothetical protein
MVPAAIYAFGRSCRYPFTPEATVPEAIHTCARYACLYNAAAGVLLPGSPGMIVRRRAA